MGVNDIGMLQIFAVIELPLETNTLVNAFLIILVAMRFPVVVSSAIQVFLTPMTHFPLEGEKITQL